MNSLGVWTLAIILYQTVACAVVSWLTLSCRLAPSAGELAELTLLKLVYLYEPRACAAPALYNYTVRSAAGTPVAALVWPAHSPPAAAFRSKLQVWLGLHVAWLALTAAHTAQRRRPCAL
ncbi:PREDICTED: uncharacterized protein LOC106125591, partial [Papilio xuthus]|uniref:Uncharacterized protein LOC106125591 n=1 Tax=Papilio xuthus TaxID=66420 RepID=A0AAJ6ZSQ8_PAPXU